MNGRTLVTTLALAVSIAGLPGPSEAKTSKAPPAQAKRGVEKIVKSEEEWKRSLTPEQFRVLRKQGTEIAFTGKYWNHHARGHYRCAACGLDLFDSATKFDSGTGWPSFWAPIDKDHVSVNTDASLGLAREEVTCARCGGHLGHVFDDGPKPTGLRYCINSAALDFAAQK